MKNSKFIVFNTYKKAQHYIRYKNVIVQEQGYFIDYIRGTVLRTSNNKNIIIGRIKEVKTPVYKQNKVLINPKVINYNKNVLLLNILQSLKNKNEEHK